MTHNDAALQPWIQWVCKKCYRRPCLELRWRKFIHLSDPGKITYDCPLRLENEKLLYTELSELEDHQICRISGEIRAQYNSGVGYYVSGYVRDVELEDILRHFSRNQCAFISRSANPEYRPWDFTENWSYNGGGLLSSQKEELEPPEELPIKESLQKPTKEIVGDALQEIAGKPAAVSSAIEPGIQKALESDTDPSIQTEEKSGEDHPDMPSEMVESPVIPAEEKFLKQTKVIEMADSYFRLESAVVLPEKEIPVQGTSDIKVVSPVGVIALVLKHMYEHNKNKDSDSSCSTLLIAGHTDTSGNTNYNRDLSANRAKTVFSLITGDSKTFGQICSKVNRWMKISDYKQILSWLHRTRGWDCDPGSVNDSHDNKTQKAVNNFRVIYNTEGPGASWAPKIDPVWGDPNTVATWEGYFHCYEEYIAQELGVDVNDLSEYRSLVKFASPNQWVGCNEYHPIESPDIDGLQEQKNRRVEIYFFDPGESPESLACSPDRGSCRKESCILYDKEKYERIPYPIGHSSSIPDSEDQELHAIRILDFDLNPMTNTPCEIGCASDVFSAITDDDGIALFALPENIDTFSISWKVPSDMTDEVIDVVREDIKLPPFTSDGLVHRLVNLGYLQDTLDEKVKAYQFEMGYPETGDENEISDEVTMWHDGGQNPRNAKSNDLRLCSFTPERGEQQKDTQGSSATGKNGTVTIGPQIKYGLYKDGSGKWAPGEVVSNSNSDLKVLKILRGSHSAIVVKNSKGLVMQSNNPDNAVPNDSAVWVDDGNKKDNRVICFFGHRFPQKPADNQDADKDHSTYIYASEDGTPVRNPLQVWVCDYPKNYVHIRLLGSALALNDYALKDHPYEMGEKAKDNSWSHSRLIKYETAEQMTEEVKKLADEQKDGVLDHLVINSHGQVMPNGAAIVVIGDAGEGNFSSLNIDAWNKLEKKVRYVWFMNCNVGADNNLFGTIAFKIKGWVLAMSGPTNYKPASVPPNHIEYAVKPAAKYWYGNVNKCQEAINPLKAEVFFMSARHSSSVAKLDREALYFNIVEKGAPLPKK